MLSSKPTKIYSIRRVGSTVHPPTNTTSADGETCDDCKSSPSTTFSNSHVETNSPRDTRTDDDVPPSVVLFSRSVSREKRVVTLTRDCVVEGKKLLRTSWPADVEHHNNTDTKTTHALLSLWFWWWFSFITYVTLWLIYSLILAQGSSSSTFLKPTLPPLFNLV